MPLDATQFDFISVPFAKAMPVEDAGARFLFIEASNEARDYQGEIVLAQALAESADYYRQFGNVDLEHITQIGPKVGIPDYPMFEVGRPVEVAVRDGRTFVKAALYQGDTPLAAKANMVWDSVTKLVPRARWYPSVGGQVLDKDKATSTIRRVRWTNIGLSRTPVNLTVPTVSTIPLGVFAKCWEPGGLDLAKALEAGYGTDAATLTGGAALRTQSLDPELQATIPAPTNYFEFRERLAGAVRKKKKVRESADAMVQHAHEDMGLSKALAADWTERFLADLKAGLNQRSPR